MNQEFTEQENAFRYLLGELGEDEQSAVEERFFTDENFSRFLDAAEADLIDEYVRGALVLKQKQNFERNFLVSERRRERVRSAQILQTEVFSPRRAVAAETPRVSFWEKIGGFFRLPNPAWAGGAAILLFLLLGGIWLARQPKDNQIVKIGDNQNTVVAPSPEIEPTTLPTTNHIEPPVNKTDEPRRMEKKPGSQTITPPVEPQNRRKPSSAPPPVFAAFTLLPPTRGAETPVLTVPSTAQNVRLQIVHDNARPFTRYRAEIRDSNGSLIQRREISSNRKSLRKPIILNLPNDRLAPGAYEISLRGATADGRFEDVNFYNFTVRKK